MIRVALLLVVALVAIGCDSSSKNTSTPSVPSSTAPVVGDTPTTNIDARDLIAKFECARCHEIPGIEPVNEHSCVRCHQEIHAGTFAAKRTLVDRWKSHITSIRWVPSLAAADRLRRSWVQAFLLAPHDLRPGLIAEMPRLAMTPEEAARLAAYITRDPADAVPSRDAPTVAPGSRVAPSRDAPTVAPGSRVDAPSSRDAPRADPLPVRPEDIARGEQLFRSLACARCHRFTGSTVDDAELHDNGRSQVGPLDGAWALAPDLRFARERMSTASIAQWIEAPRGAMPKLGVNADSARVLAEFIANAPLAEVKRPEVPKRLPVLERRVAYDEVETRVFRKVCWHCHAIPDYARGDGGPGNSGGFGFAPRGLDLATYEGVASGSFDDRGERRSVFGKLADGTPRIVAHVMARYTEEAGGSVEGVRGMPLGLPPLPLEDVQLLESWIAQGRPR